MNESTKSETPSPWNAAPSPSVTAASDSGGPFTRSEGNPVPRADIPLSGLSPLSLSPEQETELLRLLGAFSDAAEDDGGDDPPQLGLTSESPSMVRWREARSAVIAFVASLVHPYRREVEQLRTEKHGAYAERNRLVAALSKLFPAALAETDIEGWDAEWRWCVYIALPTGQVSWHIRESELPWFDHLPRDLGLVMWDGHRTPEKYERLAALPVDQWGRDRRDAERWRWFRSVKGGFNLWNPDESADGLYHLYYTEPGHNGCRHKWEAPTMDEVFDAARSSLAVAMSAPSPVQPEQYGRAELQAEGETPLTRTTLAGS